MQETIPGYTGGPGACWIRDVSYVIKHHGARQDRLRRCSLQHKLHNVARIRCAPMGPKLLLGLKVRFIVSSETRV